MTAAPVPIVCANCGAKYKLPADFKSATAKCKGCGATIDVASQLKAAAAPAASKPVSAPAPSSRPASRPVAASKAVDKPAASDAAARGARGTRERSGASSSGRRGASRASRRGAGDDEAAPKKGGKGVLIGSAVGVVALGVVGFFVFGGGGSTPAPATTPVAAAPDAGSKVPTAADAAATKMDEAQLAAKAEADALAKELSGEGAGDKKAATDSSDPEAAASKPAESKKPAKKPAKKDPDAKPEEKKPLTADEVFDSRTLPPLEFNADVEQSVRDEITSLCDDLRNGGMAGRKAKKRLEELGHPAMVGVINAYAAIDFKNPDQAMYAFEMNKLLTNAFGAGTISVNFKPTQAGEPIPLETADWNAKTVNAWRRFWDMHKDKEVWERMLKKRKEGKSDAGEDK
jgi:hypothetical protein